MNKTKIFFDTEFTGLHQNTTLISIGAISDTDKTFYAEFADFDCNQVDSWIEDNVISKLLFYGNDKKGYNNCATQTNEKTTEAFGNSNFIKNCFVDWMKQYGNVELWSDCLSYDWVLLNQLWGGALNIPYHIYYIPFDICTLFRMKNIDPDINRETYIGEHMHNKHNSLYDAKTIKRCYEKLIS